MGQRLTPNAPDSPPAPPLAPPARSNAPESHALLPAPSS